MPRRRRISASRKAVELLGAQLLHPGGDGGLVGRIGIELGEELIPGVVVELTAAHRMSSCCFQVVLVTLLGQRDRLPVPGLPFTSLISGCQQDRIALGVEDIQDADLAAPGGAWPQFFQVGQREWWTRSASGRPSSGPASSSMPMA
jgi:hypothetical protein